MRFGLAVLSVVWVGALGCSPSGSSSTPHIDVIGVGDTGGVGQPGESDSSATDVSDTQSRVPADVAGPDGAGADAMGADAMGADATGLDATPPGDGVSSIDAAPGDGVGDPDGAPGDADAAESDAADTTGVADTSADATDASDGTDSGGGADAEDAGTGADAEPCVPTCVSAGAIACVGGGAAVCTLDPATGCLVLSAPEACDDGVPCTSDGCVEPLGCTHSPIDAACSDGVACTVDSCDPTGGCQHAVSASLCDDGITCTVDSCDLVAGCVHAPDSSLCSDGVACTTDTCIAATGCKHTPDSGSCDDGVACTTDSCGADGCTHTPVDAACASADPCMKGTCTLAGCTYADYTGPCNDVDPCTVDDVCALGVCAGTPLVTEPIAAFDASHMPGLVCDPQNALYKDGVTAGVDHVAALGLGAIDGHSVSGCIGVDFGQVQPIGILLITAARKGMSCIAACGKPPDQSASLCGTDPGTAVFTGTVKGSYKYAYSPVIEGETLKDYVVSVPEPARYVLFCRGPGSHKRDDFVIDSIRLNAACAPSENCVNGKDDDNDGKIDCSDGDCVASPVCPVYENCVNGADDDDDGATDCDDSECAGSPVCSSPEDCANGLDDDKDGTLDCADRDCAFDSACAGSTLTCSDVYDCMVESGCSCQIGVSCPTGAQEQACADACASSGSCQSACLSGVPPAVQETWGAWSSCTAAHCAGVTSSALVACQLKFCTGQFVGCFGTCKSPATAQADLEALAACADQSCKFHPTVEGVQTCLYTSCLAEVTTCKYTGTATCDEVYFGCFVPCTGPATTCTDQCVPPLAPDAAFDLFHWDHCRGALCDANDDHKYDSVACTQVAYVACADEMATCGPDWVGTSGCDAVTQCLLACPTYDSAAVDGGLGHPSGCMGDCLASAAPSAVSPLSDLWTCVASTCGSTATALTPTCAKYAVTTKCSALFAACSE